MADKESEAIQLPDSNKLTFKEIARVITDKDRANKLKARVYATMGFPTEVEVKEVIRKQEEMYAKAILKKTTFLHYLDFCSRKQTDCSSIVRAVVRKYYMSVQQIDNETRLTVSLHLTSDVAPAGQCSQQDISKSRLLSNSN